MSSKWFGVGFSFMAEDKGVKDSFRKVRKELDETDESLKNVEKSSDDGKESLLSWANIAKIGFLQKINNGLNTLNETIGQVSETDRNFGAMDTLLKDFQGMGEIDAKGAQKFMTQFTNLSDKFGTDQSSLTEYVIGLQKAGFTFEEISKRLPSASKAMGIFNQTADSAVGFDKMSKRLKLTALQAEKLKQQVLSVGIATGDKEILNNLGEMQKAVAESTSFKGLSGEAAKKTILGMVKAQALVRKSLRMTSEESAGFVTNLFGNLKGTEKEFKKLQLTGQGGTEGFKELALATGDAGMAMKLLESNNVVGVVNALKGSLAGLSGEQRKSKLLFLEGIFGTEMTELMNTNLSKTGKAINDNLVNEKAIESQKTLNNLSKLKLEALEKMEKFKRGSIEFKQAEIQAKRASFELKQAEKLRSVKERAIKMEEKLLVAKMEADNFSLLGFSREIDNLKKMGTMQEKMLHILDLIGLGGKEGGVGMDLFADGVKLLSENFLELSFGATLVKGPMKWFWSKMDLGAKIASKYATTMEKVSKVTTKIGEPFRRVGGFIKSSFSNVFTGPIDKVKSFFGIIKNSISGFVSKGGGKIGEIFAKFGSKIGRSLGFLSKFMPAIKMVGKLMGKIAFPIGIAISLFDGISKHWETLTEQISQGSWGDAFVTVLEMIGDSINSFFFGIPKAIAGAINGVASGVFDDGDFFSNFKKGLADGVKDIPFIGESMYKSLMSNDSSGMGSDDTSSIKTDSNTLANGSPIGSPNPLMTRDVINTTTNNNNGFDMDKLFNGFGNIEQVIVLKDAKGNILGKTKSRLNGHSNATSR